jgi:acyl carrier protein
MATVTSVHERLEALFRQVFGDDEIVLTDATTAEDVPGWDSVAHINLMFGIEQAFGVQFLGNELAEFQNVGELVRYLTARVPDR